MAAIPAGVAYGERPTRKRYVVVALGFALAFITYIDRASIGQAAPTISRDLHLSPVQMGYVFSAFGLAYSAFEIPSGWLGDWIGPRKVLLRIVLWWSFFTAATGWAWNFTSLIVTRFLFGMGEAGCFPNLAKCFSTWLPQDERLKAEGFKAASARWGGAVTPVLFVYLQNLLGWRAVFQIFALIGVVWAGVFYAWYRDDPRQRSGLNAAELRLLEGAGRRAVGNRNVPWRRFLHSRSVWLVWANWFCYSYGFYFYLTWLPTYLQQARHFDIRKSAVLAGLPLLSAGFGSLFSGFACAWLLGRTGNVKVVRRSMAITGFAFAAVMLIVFTRLQNPLWAIAALTASSFAAEFPGPVSWTTCMDLGGRYVGSMAGGMNTLGQLGGTIAPTIIGYILEGTNQNWSMAFYASAVVYLGGILCWAFLDPVTPLDCERVNR
jgi:MFS transporter, ACS family, glucarate transporter